MTDRPGWPGAGRNPGRAPAVIAIGLAAVALAASVSACAGPGRPAGGQQCVAAVRPASEPPGGVDAGHSRAARGGQPRDKSREPGYRPGRAAAGREDHRHRPGTQRRELHRPGRHRAPGLERHRVGDLRHHRHDDRRRLPRGAVHLRRRPLPPGRPAPGRRARGDDQDQQQRCRALRRPPRPDHRRRPRERRGGHPRGRRARVRPRVHHPGAGRRRAQRHGDRGVAAVRRRRPAGHAGGHRDAGERLYRRGRHHAAR